MEITVALVEYLPDNDEPVSSSGLIFSERFVIITAHVLLPFLKQFKLDDWIERHSPGIIHYNIFKNIAGPKLNVLTTAKEAPKSANVIAGFICKNIKESCQKYLKNWGIEFERNVYHVKELLSLFFILEVCDNSDKFELNEALLELLHDAEKVTPNIGHNVFIESAPFGNRLFLHSYSHGIVSNVVGDNSCFLLTDCPSVPGSEGSPVFVKTICRRKPIIGIVISSVNWWNGEWVGLTLAANLVPLVMQLDLGYQCDVVDNRFSSFSKLTGTIISSLVQISNKSLWGTAILINKSKGIFLSNSHVIVSNTIVLHWQSNEIPAILIYKTPDADVYDLAVLQCNPSRLKNLEIAEAKISQKPVEVGEDIFSAGYPLFCYQLNPLPTITKGNVSQVHNGMLTTTCCILPGASGGAIFRSNGEVVAVIVSNLKINETGVVYPRANMVIPILAVYSILQDFLITSDVEKLSALHCKDHNIIKMWTHLYSKL